MNTRKKGFLPDQIIFSCTTACNLHCEHCFVDRTPKKLEVSQAVTFLRDCAQSGKIQKIGFSGGEPFLYMDFLLALTKEAVSLDLLFDQIMTNGDWWHNEQELYDTLQDLYNAGYDGKIGLSWDKYHGQTPQRMQTFISDVQQIFGSQSIIIQTVEGGSLPLGRTSLRPTPSAGDTPATPPVYTLPRTYTSQDPRAWQSSCWFREDYCQSPGNILYVHADGNIAPCCGFANENSALFIGKITDNFETILANAEQNTMVQRCFTEGLSHYRRHDLKKQLRACGKKLPGKTSDICSFCDYVCKMQ